MCIYTKKPSLAVHECKKGMTKQERFEKGATRVIYCRRKRSSLTLRRILAGSSSLGG
jgi:hypothetical protein